MYGVVRLKKKRNRPTPDFSSQSREIIFQSYQHDLKRAILLSKFTSRLEME